MSSAAEHGRWPGGRLLGFLMVLLILSVGIGIGTLGLWTILLLSRQKVPRDRETLLSLALLGVFNPALPFLLITWGQQFTDSAIAGILNGTVPLFSMLIAHFALPDERITFRRLAGLFDRCRDAVSVAAALLSPPGARSSAAHLRGARARDRCERRRAGADCGRRA